MFKLKFQKRQIQNLWPEDILNPEVSPKVVKGDIIKLPTGEYCVVLSVDRMIELKEMNNMSGYSRFIDRNSSYLLIANSYLNTQ